MQSELFEGRGLSSGIGFGPASVMPDINYEMEELEIHPDSVEKELERFNHALEATKNSTKELRTHLTNTLFEDLGELFIVQEALLEDRKFTNRVVRQIKEEKLCAESAVMKTMKFLEDRFIEKTRGKAQETRAVDFLDAGMRLLGHLDAPISRPRLPQGGVLVARRIAPSIAVFLLEYEITGLVVANTNRSSHVAVVAQALEIPTVGLTDSKFYETVRVGTQTIVNANRNEVHLNPDAETMEAYQTAKRSFHQFSAEIRERTLQIDSKTLPLALRGNLGLMEEISLLDKYGGRGAGLVRTEFLFLTHSTELPEEAVQAEIYHRMADFIAPEPVNLRTFDFGGDKETFKEPDEVEGRGIYRELFNQEVLRTQLRAMCRAYQEDRNISIMLPLVGTLEEIKKVRELLEKFRSQKGWEIPPLGIMVEIPSLYFALEEILPSVDYLSFGTNDLMNYLLGADRFGSPGADSVNYPDPSLFSFMQMVLEKARKADVPVGLCGEIGANPIFTPVFVGLGLDELSMAPMRIPEVKLVANRCPLQKARDFSDRALSISCREQNKQWIREELGPYVQNILREDKIPRESREFDYYEHK